MSQETLHILMTGAGAPGAAGILKCLSLEKRFRVLVADADPEAYGRYLAPDFVQIPEAGDPGFIGALLEICRKRNIRVVMPLVTRELLPLAKSHELFDAAGVKLLVSPAAALEIAVNKSRLYEFLDWRGIAVPDFRVVENLVQFKAAITELGYPGKAVCFKPSLSNGSRGFRIICDRVNEQDLLFNQKPQSLYISEAEAIRILGATPFPELLVSEFLPGEEYSVDCLARHGEAVLIVPRLRIKIQQGISVAGEFREEPAIATYCTRIIHDLGLHGNIGIQVHRSAGGQFLVLEINPRVQGSIAAGLGAGINLPVLAVKQELGLAIDAGELKPKWGVRFSRYREEVFY